MASKLSKKVAYISAVADGSGYSQAAIGNILALDSVGVDVVVRPISMTPKKYEVPERIKELCKKDLDGVTTVVQHNLPNQFSYVGGVQNIGYFAYELPEFPKGWYSHFGLMDKNIVPSEFVRQDFSHNNMHVCGHALDVSRFDKMHDKIDFGQPKDCYKFYTIAEFNDRKDIGALVVAYSNTFSAADNVLLVVKTTGDIKPLIKNVRQKLGRFKTDDLYPPITVIKDYLTTEQMDQIHYSCDCFVTTSRGESFCIPWHEAKAFGNMSIVPEHTHFYDVAKEDISFMTYESQPCSCVPVVSGQAMPYYPNYLTWERANTIDLSRQMKNVVGIKTKMAQSAQEERQKLSYETVGHKLKEIIDAQ